MTKANIYMPSGILKTSRIYLFRSKPWQQRLHLDRNNALPGSLCTQQGHPTPKLSSLRLRVTLFPERTYNSILLNQVRSNSISALGHYHSDAHPHLPHHLAVQVVDWVTVSEEHNIFITDVGLPPESCDEIVAATEQACRGQYAAYTYAKQTLGCREYPTLVEACFPPVHTVVHAIGEKFEESRRLQLDDREPHLVKYDTTKKERQKLDMHTDKSEWTFLVALSNGCGVDYEGGGTYFECIDAVIHLQRGHALIFPGKLRHCGKKILGGLRFLLVGFLVDKSNNKKKIANKPNSPRGADANTNDSDENEELPDSGDDESHSDDSIQPRSEPRDLKC